MWIPSTLLTYLFLSKLNTDDERSTSLGGSYKFTKVLMILFGGLEVTVLGNLMTKVGKKIDTVSSFVFEDSLGTLWFAGPKSEGL